MMRTKTIDLGGLQLELTIPLTARQRRTLGAEHDAALDALRDAEPQDAPGRAEVWQGWIGGMLVRMLAHDHPWRVRVRELRDAGDPEPTLTVGLDVVDELAERHGVHPSEVLAAVQRVVALGGTPPTQAEVNAAAGN